MRGFIVIVLLLIGAEQCSSQFIWKEIVVKKTYTAQHTYIVVTKEMCRLNKKEMSNCTINIYVVSSGVYAWTQLKKQFDKLYLLKLLNGRKSRKEFIRRLRIE